VDASESADERTAGATTGPFGSTGLPQGDGLETGWAAGGGAAAGEAAATGAEDAGTFAPP
jgi:hypothetical protein